MTNDGRVKNCLFLGFTKTIIFHLIFFFPPKTHNRGAFHDIYGTSVKINWGGLQYVTLNWLCSHSNFAAWRRCLTQHWQFGTPHPPLGTAFNRLSTYVKRAFNCYWSWNLNNFFLYFATHLGLTINYFKIFKIEDKFIYLYFLNTS